MDDVGPYLRQAVVNAVRGGWRRRQVERRHAGTLSTDARQGAFEADVVERDEVWRALRRLPPGQRGVVVLRYYEDLSEADVARLLRVKAGTAKSQAAKGLAALHAMLGVRVDERNARDLFTRAAQSVQSSSDLSDRAERRYLRRRNRARGLATRYSNQPGPWQLAQTHDGGASWTYEPAPCPAFTEDPSLAFNGRVLILVCAGQPGAGSQMKEVWASSDGGAGWVERAGELPGGGYLAGVTSVGPNFVVGLSRGDIMASSDNGATWRVAIATVEAFPAFDAVPGVGAWVSTGRSDALAGIWFSADGVHWEQRARGGG